VKQILSATGLLVAICVNLGCSGNSVDPVKRVKVSGTVTLDGKKVSAGNITFDAQNGQPPASLNILDGKYEGLAPVGKNKVMITATRKASAREKKASDGPGYDPNADENYLPSRYNTDSTITREVTEAGPNEFNFEATSGK